MELRRPGFPMSQPSEIVQPPAETTRRQFCAHACQAVSIAALAGASAACGGGSPTSPSGGSSAPAMATINGTVTGRTVTVTVGSGALASNGAAALIQTSIGSFAAFRLADNSVNVVTATCTHEGCTVSAFANNRFVCPCHGSQFSTSGAVQNGPATRALQSFASTFSNNVLTFTA